MWILCCTHPSRWQDMIQNKLLVLQTAHQFSGKAWLYYDTAFRKDAAASGLTDWSRMISDLYNFHTRLPKQQQFQPPTTSSSPSRSLPSSSNFCRSWNNGSCTWPYGQRRYRHRCENREGEHPCVNCPFRASASLLSACSPLALHGASAGGVGTMAMLTTCPLVKVHFWLNLMLKVRIGTFPSIQRTAICEQTLMRFCAHLVDRHHHSSVKVYLSAVHCLHIDYSYPDPLSNCHQLQRLLNAVKCNLTELTTRSTSLTSAVSGLACMCTCQDSSCSCATEHGIV